MITRRAMYEYAVPGVVPQEQLGWVTEPGECGARLVVIASIQYNGENAHRSLLFDWAGKREIDFAVDRGMVLDITERGMNVVDWVMEGPR